MTAGYGPIPRQLMYDHQPSRDWLAHDSQLHGIGHLTRVFILQELIADQLADTGTELDRQALRWAAATHDVGRLDDGIDPEHGRRSADWIKSNLADVMTPEALDTATYIVHWHVPSDSEAPSMTPELKVLKDADALDRVRLSDLDSSYLRTGPAKHMTEIAKQLYDLSQDSGDTFESVLHAAEQLGLISY